MNKPEPRSPKQLSFRTFGLAATSPNGPSAKFVKTEGRAQPIDERAQPQKFVSPIWATIGDNTSTAESFKKF